MSQTHEGALKVVAKKAGVSLPELKLLRSKGEKWCMRCRRWHPEGDFGKDRTRYDGFDASCRESRNKRQRELHQRIPPDQRKGFGPPRLPARDGDKKQARHFVNLNVQRRSTPNPNMVPCFDCGHIGPDKRHEHDHHLGYAAQYHEDVQVVCSSCHAKREVARGAWGSQQRRNKPPEFPNHVPA